MAKPIEGRYPADWHTYEILTEKFDFFPIDDDQHNMYTRLNEQFCEKVDAEHQEHKGCGWDIDDGCGWGIDD